MNDFLNPLGLLPVDVYWHKFNDAAKIPTKRDEDAGFDIYTIEDDVILMPHEKRLFSTGLGAAIDKGYWLMAFDRGSTGSRGIHTHCGVVDNGYRGEIFICLCNDNDKLPILFTSKATKIEEKTIAPYGTVLVYPTSKGIAQLIPMEQPKIKSQEASDELWELLCNTERGDGKLGASGK